MFFLFSSFCCTSAKSLSLKWKKRKEYEMKGIWNYPVMSKLISSLWPSQEERDGSVWFSLLRSSWDASWWDLSTLWISPHSPHGCGSYSDFKRSNLTFENLSGASCIENNTKLIHIKHCRLRNANRQSFSILASLKSSLWSDFNILLHVENVFAKAFWLVVCGR